MNPKNMDNDLWKAGVSEILSGLDDGDLNSLATTVTQGLLRNKVESRQEAVAAIVHYSSDVKSILKRKLVTRDLLFAYMHKKNVPVSLPITKNELIDKLISYWSLEADRTAFNTNKISQNGTEPHNAVSEETIALLAEQFSEWFYTMLNQDEVIGTEHFYADASLQIKVLVNSGQILDEIVEFTAEQITRKLFETKAKYGLHFNPNLTKEGVRGRMDHHGLVIVLTCGTLHSNNSCVGVFEQVFGLARDPFAENNWKIKNTELILRSQGGVKGPPVLCNSEMTSDLPLS